MSRMVGTVSRGVRAPIIRSGDDLVEMVFEDMEVDEPSQILGLLRKKNYDPEEPDPAKRQKMYAFLARKGFSYDAINSAMKQWE